VKRETLHPQPRLRAAAERLVEKIAISAETPLLPLTRLLRVCRVSPNASAASVIVRMRLCRTEKLGLGWVFIVMVMPPVVSCELTKSASLASPRSTRKMIRQMARTVMLQEPARSPLRRVQLEARHVEPFRPPCLVEPGQHAGDFSKSPGSPRGGRRLGKGAAGRDVDWISYLRARWSAGAPVQPLKARHSSVRRQSGDRAGRAFRLPARAWWPESGPEHRRHRRTRWRANPSDNRSNGSRISRS